MMVRAGNVRVWVIAMATMVAAIAAALAALLWWNTEPARSASTIPQGFTDSLVAQVPNPTAMAIAPDGRLFVTQKGNNNGIGRVRVIKKGQLLGKPFLNVTTDTSDLRGLLGITLDPNFSTNHYVYIFYTATSPTVHNRVSRYTANGDVAVPGSQKVLLDLPALGNTGAGGHYGGSLRFGSDGKLYIGVGDDSTPADAQSLDTVNGKILRINRNGTIPANNPFFDSTSGDRRAIWALGLRQPYSLDVQSGTSKMYVNDVGEDSWEEIDEVRRGATTGGRFTKALPPRLIQASRTTRTPCSLMGMAPPPRRDARSPAAPSTRTPTFTLTTAAIGSGASIPRAERPPHSRAG